MKVKLCGFTEEKSLICAVENGCHYIGLVFVDNSPRNVSLEAAIRLKKLIPRQIQKVAVVVNPNLSELQEIHQNFSPDIWQFHGDESRPFLERVKEKFPNTKIIKAFRFGKNIDFSQIKDFEMVSDFYLFDSLNAGSGNSFDWRNFAEMLPELKSYSSRPWFLSGGINAKNLLEAIKITKAELVDISSGIEEFRGIKSPSLISELLRIVKSEAKN